VQEHLKRRWELHPEGDEAGLPQIVQSLPRTDLFHYDSDKSYSGRAFAIATIQPRLHARSLVIMDDIGDNSFFHDLVQPYLVQPYLVQRERPSAFAVFHFQRKYIGVIGPLHA